MQAQIKLTLTCVLLWSILSVRRKQDWLSRWASFNTTSTLVPCICEDIFLFVIEIYSQEYLCILFLYHWDLWACNTQLHLVLYSWSVGFGQEPTCSGHFLMTLQHQFSLVQVLFPHLIFKTQVQFICIYTLTNVKMKHLQFKPLMWWEKQRPMAYQGYSQR